jgi:hypothetical protein
VALVGVQVQLLLLVNLEVQAAVQVMVPQVAVLELQGKDLQAARKVVLARALVAVARQV